MQVARAGSWHSWTRAGSWPPRRVAEQHALRQQRALGLFPYVVLVRVRIETVREMAPNHGITDSSADGEWIIDARRLQEWDGWQPAGRD